MQNIQSLPNVLVHLKYFLDCLINIPPLPLKTISVYGKYSRSTHVNLPADNSNRCIYLTQHSFKVGRGWFSFVADRKRSIVMESALLNECSKDFWQRMYIQIARLPPEDMHKIPTNVFVPNVLQKN